MINPKELRIGNIIYCVTNKLNVTVQWPHLAEVVINVQWPDGGGCEHVHAGLEECEPIPLTPEWLERCGFTWDKGYMKINLKHARMALGFYAGVSDKMSLFQTTIPGEGSIEHEIGFGSNHPEYIHQLQNLYFDLTGEELTIKS